MNEPPFVVKDTYTSAEVAEITANHAHQVELWLLEQLTERVEQSQFSWFRRRHVLAFLRREKGWDE